MYYYPTIYCIIWQEKKILYQYSAICTSSPKACCLTDECFIPIGVVEGQSKIGTPLDKYRFLQNFNIKEMPPPILIVIQVKCLKA